VTDGRTDGRPGYRIVACVIVNLLTHVKTVHAADDAVTRSAAPLYDVILDVLLCYVSA